jgi:hypothetical protein
VDNRFPISHLLAIMLLCMVFALMLFNLQWKHRERMLEIEMEHVAYDDMKNAEKQKHHHEFWR